MKAVPMLLTALLVGAVAAMSGCADHSTTGPAAGAVATPIGASAPQVGNTVPQDHDTARTVARNAALVSKCRPLKAEAVNRRIGPAGGSLVIGPHTLTVPPGALSREVMIHAKIAGGKSVNVVEFKPDGLVFQIPAVLTMSYANCDREGRTSALAIAVVDDTLGVVDYIPSSDDAATGTVTGDVPDLTNYAVAW
jgi:hypothetical protein